MLDANIDRYPALVTALEAEQRVLAITAGLAGPFEPVDEITKIGASFMALIRHSAPRHARKAGAPNQLLRLFSSAG